MENKETMDNVFSKALKETRKPGFLKALLVFLCCVIIGLIIGIMTDSLQLSMILGIGLGLIWMGVAYFNQKE